MLKNHSSSNSCFKVIEKVSSTELTGHRYFTFTLQTPSGQTPACTCAINRHGQKAELRNGLRRVLAEADLW